MTRNGCPARGEGVEYAVKTPLNTRKQTCIDTGAAFGLVLGGVRLLKGWEFTD